MSVQDHIRQNNASVAVWEEYMNYGDNMKIPPINFTINIQGDLVLYGILLSPRSREEDEMEREDLVKVWQAVRIAFLLKVKHALTLSHFRYALLPQWIGVLAITQPSLPI